ncbi:MAG: hypothetical protein HY719_12790 [Planctomycetes bacterium]|nr:hypothetical protein [Planctomycetota bacterium]
MASMIVCYCCAVKHPCDETLDEVSIQCGCGARIFFFRGVNHRPERRAGAGPPSSPAPRPATRRSAGGDPPRAIRPGAEPPRLPGETGPFTA